MPSRPFPHHENYSSGTPLFQLIAVTIIKVSTMCSRSIFHAL